MAKLFISTIEQYDYYTGEVIAPEEPHYETVGGRMVKFHDLDHDDRFYVCEACGRLIDAVDDNTNETSDGSIVCDDCLEENYFYCEECETWHPTYELITVYAYGWQWWSTKDICEDCANSSGSYFYCEDCETWRMGESYETHDGRIICEECLNQDYERCDDCGRIFRRYDMVEVGWGRYLCDDCRDNRAIWGYHDHDRSSLERFNTDGQITGTRLYDAENRKLIGWELEVENSDRYGDNCEEVARKCIEIMRVDGHDRIHCEHDGSLENGFEAISKPHTYEAFKNLRIKELLAYLASERYTSHDNGDCGLHIHVSNEWFGDDIEEQKRNVAKVLYLYDKMYEFFLTLSRREEWQARDWAQRVEFCSVESALNGMWRSTGHGVAVNVANMGDFGTVEFRLGRGTLNYDTFMAWADIHIALARNAKDIADGDLDLNKWLKGITMATRGYILNKTGVLVNINRRRVA